MTDKPKLTIAPDMLPALDARAEAAGLRIEIDDGEIVEVERAVTWEHLLIIRFLFRRLDRFAEEHGLGLILPDGARYLIDVSEEGIVKARIPDLSFLRRGRLPADFDPRGDFTGAPDLAVEVASPGQSASALLRKIADYLEAGCEEAWLIHPPQRTLHRFRRDAYGSEQFVPGDTLETLLFPGLRLAVAELFETQI